MPFLAPYWASLRPGTRAGKAFDEVFLTGRSSHREPQSARAPRGRQRRPRATHRGNGGDPTPAPPATAASIPAVPAPAARAEAARDRLRCRPAVRVPKTLSWSRARLLTKVSSIVAVADGMQN